MTARCCADASALVALLVDGGVDGRWAAGVLAGAELVAPELVRFEGANILRRLELAGLLSADQAVQAHADLLDLDIEGWPYDLVAPRAWELRRNLSIYDATYVAVAEVTGSTLVTLDRRLGGAPSLRCAVVVP
ncbi:MAG: type II toxin-antitoxin system VapC family toxin [Actinomycetota bacterium]|nr:type II toxin-antitoxin system VapC family toxin [Actinomycetota bacterium]